MKTIYTLAIAALVSAMQAQVQKAIPRNAQLEAQQLKKLELESKTLRTGNHAAAKPSAGQWQLLTGSMNVYGMLIPGQHPLNYNRHLNAISFIHRKSDYYTESPLQNAVARSGVIVAEISSNGGLTWDSTCVYANGTNWGRYPQGAIYNTGGNTSLANAQLVGCGVTVDNAGFSGSWYASKSLSNYNSTAGTLTAQQQYYSFNQGPYAPAMPRHGWMYQGFTVTDDGIVHAAGVQGQDLQGTTELTAFAVASASFNGLTFDWKIDTLVPPAVKKSDSISLHITEPKMAWNNDGTIGYLFASGVFKNASLSNRSYQPIVYKIDKTNNAAATWTLLPALDFNSTFTEVPAHLEVTQLSVPVGGQNTAALPFLVEFDGTVDKLGRLHLATVFCSGYSDHVDSLQYYGTYTTAINPTEAYRWKHLPGHHPYLYDFIGDGNTAWQLLLIDSLSSESPGFVSGNPGYQENPWDEDEGQKIPMDARVQMSRSADGEVLFISYAESDSMFTNAQLKYNNLPDVHLRAIHLYNPCIISISNPIVATTNDNSVRSRATLHYISPLASSHTITMSSASTYSIAAEVPLTVTNSNPYSQLTNNATWFNNERHVFKFYKPEGDCIGIIENKQAEMKFSLLPNPAHHQVLLSANGNGSEKVQVVVRDVAGKAVLVKSAADFSQPLKLDLTDVCPGLYFVSLIDKSGQISTKKLVID